MNYFSQDQDFLKQLTVLYVEDEEDTRNQLEQLLRRRVGTLITAHNGAEGLESFRAQRPHIVITDIRMPVMDGLSMAQEIINLDRNVPIIVTTAFDQTDYLMRSLNIGVDKYVTKPVDSDHLHAALLSCAYRLRVDEQLRLAAAVFDCCLEAIFITDADNCIIAVNHIFCEITGYSVDEVIGKNPGIFASGLHDQSFYREMWQEVLTRGSWQGEIDTRRKNGDMFPAWLAITTLHDEKGRITKHIGVFSDISERKAAERQIQQLAMHDALTGLPNRNLLKVRFDLALANASRNGQRLALLYIDLDDFKRINDSLGHHIGDLVLQEISRRLQGLFRSCDTVSRLGGDEFLIVVNEVREAADAMRAAEKALTTLAQPMVVETREMVVTPSIGISLYPTDGADMETLIRNADAAMYRAKRGGKDDFRFFSPA